MVIEDDPNILELLTEALSSVDGTVVVADSVRGALESAEREAVDFVVADLRLPDGFGTDVIADLRQSDPDLPAVVITGCKDTQALAEATRVGLVEVMTKPVDMGRLQQVVRDGLVRRRAVHRSRRRALRLRDLAREMNQERKVANEHLETTCADLTAAYRALSGQMALQQMVLSCQGEMVAAKSDDETFRAMFQMFAKHSGPLFGVALVCDEEATLRIIGRFGVPRPDGLAFCRALVGPLVDMTMKHPEAILMDTGAESHRFGESIQRYLPGLSALSLPLIPNPGEMIGLVVLYRKGEQPFSDTDVALAEMIAHSAALAVMRND